jgi:thiamine-monophosphate kinase
MGRSRSLDGVDDLVDVTEQDLLAAIARLLAGPHPGVVIGVGDDAAVVERGSGELVLTTDALVEGSHFDRSTTSARHLGCKAITVNVSDVAAMAASPRFALCALTLTDDTDVSWTMELFGGMREACDEYGLTLVGGNLSRGSEVNIVVTVIGEVAPGRAVTRSGAEPGDIIVVTGALGSSAAGFRLMPLRQKWTEDERAAVRRHFRPTARVGEGLVLARNGATSMIDVSDGLAIDLGRIAKASSVGVRLHLADVPLDPAARREEALAGGEDYELLATMPPGRVDQARMELSETFGVPLTTIGVVASQGCVVVDDDGTERALESAGWDHFA